MGKCDILVVLMLLIACVMIHTSGLIRPPTDFMRDNRWKDRQRGVYRWMTGKGLLEVQPLTFSSELSSVCEDLISL